MATHYRLIRLLVVYCADIHFAENSNGCTPLFLIDDKALKADMVFLTRRPLLLFFEAASFSDDSDTSRSLRRMAGNPDLVRVVIMFW